MMIAVVGLLVIGPARLPETLRTLGLWLGRLRRSFVSVKAEIEKEIGMDEIKRQLHNEAVMDEMKRIEKDVQHSMSEGVIDPNPTTTPPPINTTPTPAVSAEDTPTSHDDSPSNDEINDSSTDSEQDKPRPRSEAELEAMHESAQRHNDNQQG